MDTNLAQKAKLARRKLIGESATLLSGAFALVAALAWNDAVKSLIDAYLPTAGGIYSKFAYALILTALVVFVSAKLSSLTEESKKE